MDTNFHIDHFKMSIIDIQFSYYLLAKGHGSLSPCTWQHSIIGWMWLSHCSLPVWNWHRPASVQGIFSRRQKWYSNPRAWNKQGQISEKMKKICIYFWVPFWAQRQHPCAWRVRRNKGGFHRAATAERAHLVHIWPQSLRTRTDESRRYGNPPNTPPKFVGRTLLGTRAEIGRFK